MQGASRLRITSWVINAAFPPEGHHDPRRKTGFSSSELLLNALGMNACLTVRKPMRSLTRVYSHSHPVAERFSLCFFHARLRIAHLLHLFLCATEIVHSFTLPSFTPRNDSSRIKVA